MPQIGQIRSSRSTSSHSALRRSGRRASGSERRGAHTIRLCSGWRPATLTALVLPALVLLAWPAGAWAGDVKGQVEFEPRKLGSPPERNQGFIERIENPLRPIRSFEPRPHMVVMLEDGPVDEAASQAPSAPVTYALAGESFDPVLLPVVVGTRVELRNRGPREVVLFTPDDPDLLDSVTLKPKGFHEITVAKPGEAVLIRAQDSVHLNGRVVAFPHRYFAAVDDRGRFEIKGVPDGTWKARVWYRDGWLEGVESTVEVGRKSPDVTIKVNPAQVRQALAK